MNPFGYNLKSRCRNRAKRFSNRHTSPTSDVFGYNERSEVIFSRGDAEDAEYSYNEIGNLVACSSASITYHYVANNLNQYTTILRASASPREINPQCDLDGNLISKSSSLADFFRHGLIAGAGKGISSILISGSDFIIDNARQPDTYIISKIEKIYHNTALFFPAMDGVLHYQECEKYLFKFTKWVEKQIGPSKKVEIDLLNTDREIPAKTFPEAIEAINKELLLKLKN